MATIYRDNFPIPQDKGAAYTVLPSDGGKVLVQTSATAGFTLPALADIWDGWNVEIFNIGATSLVITAPSGKMVGFNNAAATTATFNTSGNIVGAAAKVVYDGTTGKYLLFCYGPNTCTMS